MGMRNAIPSIPPETASANSSPSLCAESNSISSQTKRGSFLPTISTFSANANNATAAIKEHKSFMSDIHSVSRKRFTIRLKRPEIRPIARRHRSERRTQIVNHSAEIAIVGITVGGYISLSCTETRKNKSEKEKASIRDTSINGIADNNEWHGKKNEAEREQVDRRQQQQQQTTKIGIYK